MQRFTLCAQVWLVWLVVMVLPCCPVVQPCAPGCADCGRPIISSRASACEENLAPGRGQSVGADPNAPFCARSKSEKFFSRCFQIFSFPKILILVFIFNQIFRHINCFRRSVTKYRVDTAHRSP